ncbi:MAG: FtsW/RodA/SpoVE family cell cycle protein [Clostridia bacterium]|nr:FtsW/RodA/SpoVE family cell cycle protein [Clostridia bacterium]
MIESTDYDGAFVLTREFVVQAASYVLGFVVIFIMNKFSYTALKGTEKWLYLAAIVLLLTVYIPGLGVDQFGSRAWIKIPGLTTIQPSEFVKILFILIMAMYFAKHRNDLHDFKGLLKAGAVAAPIILIVLKEDLGSALVFAAIWLAMLFLAGVSYRVLAKFFLIIALAIPVAYKFMADYQKVRIEAFLHPDNLSLEGNFQVWQSKIAIGSGGFFGKGLFQGSQKSLDFIPVQKSDFIFSVIGEELGFIGGALTILLFAFLLYRIARMINFTGDDTGALIVVGILGMFIFQVFENIAMTMGIMPVTGITLPFISNGGSSILSNMMAIGLVLNVYLSGNNISFKVSGKASTLTV